MAVASAPIGGDQKFLSSFVELFPHPIPPAPYALHRELRGIGADADVDPPAILCDIVDSVRRRTSKLLVHKIVDVDFLGLSDRLPLLSGVLVIPDQFFLLGIDGNRRFSGSYRLTDFCVDMLEL